MERRLHLLESFTAKGSDGMAYKVLGYERMLRNPAMLTDGIDLWEPTGVAEYRLETGELVDVAPDGTMRVVSSGVSLTRH